MFCLPLFPFLCGFWDFFDSFKKSKSSQKTPKEHVEICIWFWNLNWKIETNSLEWSVFENTDITVSKMNCCRIIMHSKMQKEHQRKQRQQRQMQRSSQRSQSKEGQKTQQHEEIWREGDAEPNRRRMQELHQADHLEPFGWEWREIDAHGVRRREYDQSDEQTGKRNESEKTHGNEQTETWGEIAAESARTREQAWRDVLETSAFACSGWHVLSTYF